MHRQLSDRHGAVHTAWHRPLAAGLVWALGTGCGLAAEPPGTAIPIEVLGKTWSVAAGVTRDAVRKDLKSVFTDAPSIDSKERLQYDAVLVPDQAPVSVVCDFNAKGQLTDLGIDAYEKVQNPPVQALVTWLKSHAGKPKAAGKGRLVWDFGGWRIEHRFGGSGEDSTYSADLHLSKGGGAR